MIIMLTCADMCLGCQVCVILPGQLPVTTDNLNWTPITVGIALTVIFGAWYFPKWGASNWYKGKSHTLPERRRIAQEARL